MQAKQIIQDFINSIDRKDLIKLLVWAVILVSLSLAVTHYIGEDQIKQRVEEAWVWWPLVIILWKSLSIIVAPLSGTATYVIAGALFWFWKWNLYNLIGNAIGMTIWFWIWRTRWADAIHRLIWKKSALMVQELTNKLEDTKTFIITRIVLFPLEDLINFASGMSKIRYLPFLIISLLITSLVAMIWVWIGDALF